MSVVLFVLGFCLGFYWATCCVAYGLKKKKLYLVKLEEYKKWKKSQQMQPAENSTK